MQINSPQKYPEDVITLEIKLNHLHNNIYINLNLFPEEFTRGRFIKRRLCMKMKTLGKDNNFPKK